MSPRARTLFHRPARLRRWRVDARGAAAVEFALVLPVLLLIYLGGYEVAQAVSTYRKVCDTTAQLANIVTQESSLTSAELTTYMDATSQIMAPYSTTSLKVVVSEIQLQTDNTAQVVWSQGYQGGTPNTKGSTWSSLPTALVPATACTVAANCISYILVQSSYTYTPKIGAAYFPTSVPMYNQLYMSPRQVTSIPCADCS